MVASKQVETPVDRGMGRKRRRGFQALVQSIMRPTVPFLRKIVVQLQNAEVMTCWTLLHRKLHRLLVAKFSSRQLQ